MALLNLVVAGAPELTVRHRHSIRNILVDESTDERDAVVKIVLWKELVGTLCGRSQRVTTQGPRVIGLLPRNVDVQRWYEERGGGGRNQIQEPSAHVKLNRRY